MDRWIVLGSLREAPTPIFMHQEIWSMFGRALGRGIQRCVFQPYKFVDLQQVPQANTNHEAKASQAKCSMIWGLRRTWANVPSQKKMSRKASQCRDQWAGPCWRSKPCFWARTGAILEFLMSITILITVASFLCPIAAESLIDLEHLLLLLMSMSIKMGLICSIEYAK
jgi:hypothetical protein